MKELEEQFNNIHLLERDERVKLINKLETLKPDFLKPYYPRWWWWRRCNIKVLIVCDGGLNFGTGSGGLSEFLTTFNRLQASTWNNYQLTLGHRQPIVATSPNPLVVNTITTPFNFQTSVNLNDYDQVWLFGILSGLSGLPANELTVVENYMNNGGGLFATGDHGSLGSSLCANITRVKDMRHWKDTPNSNDNFNEVSMNGKRRNDTNRPAPGQAVSLYFDNQSDNIPQNIGFKTFTGGLPHPLLSIKTSLRPSGIIDIMPDHPHEGECKPETSFTVNGVTVPTQNIATSFVLGGSTTHGGIGGKTPTDPHCFPSIGVWDGHLANAGRIVVDSTWHHFVNINLNGVGSTIDLSGIQSGLSNSDLDVIKQYFMNISLWMSRRKSWWCWRRILFIDMLKNSQIIEASLNNPDEKLEKISFKDISSIGSLAEEILSSKINPSFAREFLVESLNNINPELALVLNPFNPEFSNKGNKFDFNNNWINMDIILYTMIGAGFLALRDDKIINSDEINEKDLDRVQEIYSKGAEYGLKLSLDNFKLNLKAFSSKLKF